MRGKALSGSVPPTGLVYSTDAGRMCPSCRRPVTTCQCASAAAQPPTAAGKVQVLLEKKGRGGKTVTLVKGLPLDAQQADALAKQLKAACGSGGTFKDGMIEVQGDHRERVIAVLQGKGLMR